MPNNNLKMDLPRCSWVNLQNPLYVKYHDCEWGKPVHDDHRLFEMLLLESFQAGLSWETVLNKRAAFKQAFAGFDVDRSLALMIRTVNGYCKIQGSSGIV